jgi:integrase
MASVFKRKKRNGKSRDVWSYKYRATDGSWVYGMGWPDKQKTLDHARQIEGEHRAIRKGEKDAAPSWQRNRNKPIAEVIKEFLQWGRAQGGRGGRPWDSHHAKNKEHYLSVWVKELDLKFLRDIELVKVERYSRELLDGGRRHPKTVAKVVESIRSLCCWSVKRSYLRDNPLRGLAKLDGKARYPHRSLTDDEISRLLNTAPPERRIWYEVGLATGFRVSELRALKVKNLDVNGPALTLESENTKNRKDCKQPISRSLCEKLIPLCEGKRPLDRLLGVPAEGSVRGAAGVIQRDYKAAGIALMTDDGKATWHSLRKCFVNAVIRAGADVKTVMELARHSSATMSMDIYAKAQPAILRQAAEAAENQIRKAVAKTCSPGVPPQNRSAKSSAITVEVAGSCGDFEKVRPEGLEPSTR